MKKDYLAGGTMADSADLVVLGAYYGTGSKGDSKTVQTPLACTMKINSHAMMLSNNVIMQPCLLLVPQQGSVP